MTQRPDDLDGLDERLAGLLGGLEPDDWDRADPPDGVWASIAERVAGEAAEPIDPVHADQPDRPVVLSDRRRAARSGAGRRSLRLAAAAAVTLLVAGAGVVWAATRDSSPGAPKARLLASARLEQLVPLGSTSASARLIDEGGRDHLVIDAHDMAPPPEGFDYEVWLIDSKVSDPRSLGTVTGSEDVVVPSTVDPAKYPVVDISLEPRDGNHQHSGHSLMRGTLRA